MQEFRDFLIAHPLLNGTIVRMQFHNSDECWRYETITSHLEELEKAKGLEGQGESKDLEESKEPELANLSK
jgi:hypothetical protein